MRKPLLLGGAFLFLAAVLFFAVVPGQAFLMFNKVAHDDSVKISAEARALHETLLIADLHDDALLWDTDLGDRLRGGHSDIPRAIEGGLGLVVFSTVTQASPAPKDKNTGDESIIGLLHFAQLRPVSSWFSPHARALAQAGDLHTFESRTFRIVRTREDLMALGFGTLGGLLATEGMQAAEGDLKKAEALYDAGFRMFGLTHFFDNAFAGSSHGVERYGLTELGRALVRFAERKGVIIDLAHTSEATIRDVTDMATKPVVVSHTGVRGTCEGQRNLSDDSIRRIAGTGGVIGIGFWATAVCETKVAAIVKAIRYVSDLVGVDYVGLGSDFNGTVTTPFDAAEMALLTQGLLDAGFSEEDIRKIMGGNVFRVLRETLP